MQEPRHILITGGGGGIGEALALAYAARGTRLALSDCDAVRLEAVGAACRDKGAEVEAACLDVTDADGMKSWIEAQDRIRPLDLVIANAGISSGAGEGRERADRVRRIFAINVHGVINTVEPAIPLMAARRRGQIAIMSSLTAFRGLPSSPAYSASKAAVKAYGEGQRVNLARQGIAVSVICPGYVRTRMTATNKSRMLFLVDVERAARLIKRGLALNKARIAFPFPFYPAVLLLAVLPPALTDLLLKRMPEKE